MVSVTDYAILLKSQHYLTREELIRNTVVLNKFGRLLTSFFALADLHKW